MFCSSESCDSTILCPSSRKVHPPSMSLRAQAYRRGRLLRSSSETRSRPGDKSPGQSGAAAHSWTGLVKSRYQRPNEGRIRHLAHLSQSRVPAFLTLALLILGMRVCMRDLDSSRIHRRELGCFVGGGAAALFLTVYHVPPRPSPSPPKERKLCPSNGRSGPAHEDKLPTEFP
jgi:hypothetical protein